MIPGIAWQASPGAGGADGEREAAGGDTVLPHIPLARCTQCGSHPALLASSPGPHTPAPPHTPATPRHEKPCSPRARRIGGRELTFGATHTRVSVTGGSGARGEGNRSESSESRISTADTRPLLSPPRGGFRGVRGWWVQSEDDGVEEWRADGGWAGGRAVGEMSAGWECASECEGRSAASSRPPTGSAGGMSLLNVTMVSRPPTGHALLYSDRPSGAFQLFLYHLFDVSVRQLHGADPCTRSHKTPLLSAAPQNTPPRRHPLPDRSGGHFLFLAGTKHLTLVGAMKQARRRRSARGGSGRSPVISAMPSRSPSRTPTLDSKL